MTMIQAFKCFILLLITALSNGYSRDHVRAAHFHRQALELVSQDRYELSLAHFRAACRSHNGSALYWNDLGVTEMRLGQYSLARKRFLKALSIDPQFDLAIQNINDLEYFSPAITTSQSGPLVGEARLHKIMRLRELSHEEFTLLSSAFVEYSGNDERHEFVQSILSEPFVIKNAFSLLNISEASLEAIFNRQFLTTTYGHHKVDFYPHNMLAESSHPYFLNLGSALHQLLYKPEEVYVGVDASEPGTYVQWNLDYVIWNDVLSRLGATLPSIFRDAWAGGCLKKPTSDVTSNKRAGGSTDGAYTIDTDADGAPVHHFASSTTTTAPTAALDTQLLSQFYLSTHWQMLLLAEAHAGMFLHKDTLRTASWQLQLVGRKKWHVCSDTNAPFLYKPGDVDMFAVDYASHPLVRKAECYEVTLNPGDILYYPHDFWHQTVNLDTPSIAVSSTLVTPLNHMHVADELRTECVDNALQRIFAYDHTMCKALEACYEHWSTLYKS